MCVSTVLRCPLTWLIQSHFIAGTISFIMQFIFPYRIISETQLSPVPWEELNIYTFATDASALHNRRLSCFAHSVNVRIWWFSAPPILVCVSVSVKRHFGSFSCLQRVSNPHKTAPVRLTGHDTGLNEAVLFCLSLFGSGMLLDRKSIKFIALLTSRNGAL